MKDPIQRYNNDVLCILGLFNGAILVAGMRWAGHVAHMGDIRNVYKILVGNPEERRLLGRHKRRWEDNIKMDQKEIGFEKWIVFIWLRIGTGGGPL
jgi:hypothetical protein